MTVTFSDTSGKQVWFYLIEYKKLNSNSSFIGGNNVLHMEGQITYSIVQGGLQPMMTYLIRVVPKAFINGEAFPGNPSPVIEVFTDRVQGE